MQAIKTYLGIMLLKPLVLIYGVITSTAYTILFGTLPMIFWFPETYYFIINSNSEVQIAFLWLSLFPTTIGYLTWTYAVGYFGANKALSLIHI